eukprot:SAG31_NODE_3935_length_3737_cov_1.467565_3_plen_164_part_00
MSARGGTQLNPLQRCFEAVGKVCSIDKATGTEAECEDCAAKAVIAAAAKNCTTTDVAAVPSAFCGNLPQPVRARGWAARRRNSSTTCTYLVAVNTDEEKPAQFSLSVDPKPPLKATAARLFEAGYSLSFANNTFLDWIGPGDVNIYSVGDGCHKLQGSATMGD